MFSTFETCLLPMQHVCIIPDSISTSAMPSRHRVPLPRHHVSLLPARTDGMYMPTQDPTDVDTPCNTRPGARPPTPTPSTLPGKVALEGRQSMLEKKPHITVVCRLDNDATEMASPDHNDIADQVLVECRLQQAKRPCRGQPRGSKPVQSCYLHTEEPTALTLSGTRVVLPFPIPPTLYRRCLADPVE